MWKWTKKGNKGFTLVELMVVMAILGVLAAIVTPAVSGTKQVGKDAQVKTDGTNIQTAAGKFNTDANTAELVTSATRNILGVSATYSTSNRWSEQHVITAYSVEFPQTAANTADTVAELVIDTALGSATNVVTGAAFAADYTAVLFSGLSAAGYITEAPAGAEGTFSTDKAYHNYLWVMKKIAANQDATDLSGRTVEVYKLTKIEASTVVGSTSADKLTYKRIF